MPHRQCTAKSKRSGQRCKAWAVRGKDVCHIHGGKTPNGVANPNYQHGRYSRYLPARLLDRYHEAEADGELLALRAEIALIDSRLLDVLKRVESGESSRIWSKLGESVDALQAAQLIGDEIGQRHAISSLIGLVAHGQGDWAAWGDVRALIMERKALVESERKRLVEMQQMVTATDALSLMAQLVDAVREAGDERTLRAVMAAFVRITGIAPALAADGGADGAAIDTDAVPVAARNGGNPRHRS
jgi:hypothetical protein